MTPFVLDCSVAAAWCLRATEPSGRADEMLRLAESNGICVPSIWPLELANALWSSERHGRITHAEIKDCFEVLEELSITIEAASLSTAFNETLDLCRAHGLTAYDAAYLEAAVRRAAPIATFDKRLATAAQAAGLTVT